MRIAGFSPGLILVVSACIQLGFSPVWASHDRARDTFITVDPSCQRAPLYVRLNCIMRRYRTFDGTCNNLCNITQGSAGTRFARLLPPYFQNGLGPRRYSKFGSSPLKNPRTISNTVFVNTSENEGNMPSNFSHMTMLWGAFIDHDFTLTLSNGTQGCGVNDAPCPDNVPGCVSIPISQMNPDDRLKDNPSVQCIPLSRSAIKNGEQVNGVSSYLDASNIYGANCQEADSVRDSTSNIGLLRVVPLPVRRSDRLPISPPADPTSFCRSPRPSLKPCFLFGDFRDNENPAFMALHTLFVREHNRIAKFFHHLNPTWTDERLFQEARKIVAAHIQHITYNEWLPVLFSERVRRAHNLKLEPMGQFFNGYDPNIDASTFNSLAAAGFRMGHSLIRESLGQFSKAFQRLGEIPITRFFDPSSLYTLTNNGIDGINLGLVTEPAQRFDRNFVNGVHENLVMPGPNDGTVGDLMAINIQRGRDHGLAPYIHFRKACGLDTQLKGSLAKRFSDLLTNIDKEQVGRIRRSYESTFDIDLFVGGISEEPQEGSILGRTFTCLFGGSFERFRLGDRFWYERKDTRAGFTLEQLDSIRKGSSLAKIICDNSDNVVKIQERVFENSQNKIHCDQIPSIDLSLWKEGPGVDRPAECETCRRKKTRN